jgi:hypothetical protein
MLKLLEAEMEKMWVNEKRISVAVVECSLDREEE